MPRRIAVRRSPVHGRGVFALADIAAEDFVVEYRGEVIAWATAHERYAASDADEGHTFYFDRGDGTVIDGGSGGNSARWVNHGCDPNCEATDDDGRIYFHAVRDIATGDELFIDYRLTLDEPLDDETRLAYACRCGAPTCRGTMLAPD